MLLQTLLFIWPFPFRDEVRLGCWCPDFESGWLSRVSSCCQIPNCIFPRYTHSSFVLAAHSFSSCSTWVNCCTIYWCSSHRPFFSYVPPTSISGLLQESMKKGVFWEVWRLDPWSFARIQALNSCSRSSRLILGLPSFCGLRTGAHRRHRLSKLMRSFFQRLI